MSSISHQLRLDDPTVLAAASGAVTAIAYSTRSYCERRRHEVERCLSESARLPARPYMKPGPTPEQVARQRAEAEYESWLMGGIEE